MDTQHTRTLIIGFIAILIGVILIGVIASETVKYTKLSRQSDSLAVVRIESNSINTTTPYTLTKGTVTGTWKAEDGTCSIPTLSVYNGTVAAVNLLTVGDTGCSTGDYNYTADSGILRLCNSTAWNAGTSPNTSVVEYSYCPNTYVSSSWGRVIMNTVPGFFAVGLLVFGAFLIFKVLKEEGIVVST